MELNELDGTEVAYDTDFFQWTRHTAHLIRAGRFNAVDLEHVADEIEDMGKRDRREMESRLIVLVMHLLKWQSQPLLREGSTWRSTILEQRSQLSLVLRDSPSLRRVTRTEIPTIYKQSLRRASAETDISRDTFPSSCPYTATDILDPDFFPD